MLSLKKKLTHGLIALATVFQMSGIAALVPVQTALAATTCTNDQQGANDEPGQKDLTRYCIDLTPVSGNITVGWQWDDTAWSGNNSGDACALFDINGDGNSDINFAVCATINGPASLTNVRRYTCSDNAEDKCTNPALQATANATCSVLVSGTQPFGAGSDSPNDSVASCTIALSAVGGANSTFEDVCSYPSQQPNSDPSDCVVISTGTPPAKLEIKKVLSPTNDSGRFNLTLDGSTQASAVGNNGTTGTLGLEYGTYTVGETAAVGDLANYTTSITCKKGGTTVAGPTVATSISVTLSDNVKDVTCTITNTRKTGKVKLIKSVTNNNGGTLGVNNFGLTINGQATTSGTASASIPAGTQVTINEAGANGYQFVSITGEGCPQALGGIVTIVADQTTTCTITNDDIAPELTVIKHVVNSNGANDTAANFTMNVTGTSASPASFAGSEAGTKVTLNAGTYSVDETFVGDGYTKSIGSGCAGTIALGEKKTCTITNTSVNPTIKVVKHVINDNGGTLDADDFGIMIGNSPVVFGAATSVDNTTKTSTYSSTSEASANQLITISESDVAGYTEGTWSCTDNSTGALLSVDVTLDEGEDVTCTITNNDVAPTLTLFKDFNNVWGTDGNAEDFTFYIGANTATLGDPMAIMPGVVNFSESFLTGWSLVEIEGENCGDPSELGGSFTAALGVNYQCTLVNHDEPATLEVTKFVRNDNGGTLEAEDFAEYITVDYYDADWDLGDTLELRTDTMYTVDEMLPSELGYSFDGVNCFDVTGDNEIALKGNSFTPYPGQEITCTVFNDDIAPELTVYKLVKNDNSGESESDDFTMNVEGTDVSDESFPGSANGTTVTLDAGSYSVEEGEHEGYEVSYSDGCEGSIKIGQKKTCYVTNEDNPHPSISVEKYGPDTAHEGDEVAYAFYVYNDGDVDLSDVDLSDDIAGTPEFSYSYGGNEENDILEVGETWVYYVYYTIPEGTDENVINTATVCADMYEDDEYLVKTLSISEFIEEDYVERDTCDEDSHELDVLHPSINVVKTGPASAKAGDTVTYTFTVTNTGDVDLEDIVISDSITGEGTYVSGDTDEDNMLDLDETWIYTGTYVIPVNQTADVTNIVKACGYERIRYSQEDSVSRQEIVIIDEQEREPVCSNDDHRLSIPITVVLGKTLSKTGTGTTIALMLTGSVMLAVAGLEFSRRQIKLLS